MEIKLPELTTDDFLRALVQKEIANMQLLKYIEEEQKKQKQNENNN